MILTCPDCATSYYVPDAAVGQGRKVRCATCGFAWRARPEDDQEEEHLYGGGADEPIEGVDYAPEAGPDADPGIFAEADGAEEEAEAPERAEEPPLIAPLPPARARASSGLAPAAVQGLAWGGMAVVVALIIGLAILMRVQVVQLWPSSAGAYARIGLPVNAAGVSLQEVRARRLYVGGAASLTVSGVMTNVLKGPVTPPPLSITLRDKSGRIVRNVTSAEASAPLASGASRSFSVALADAPAASELDVDFVLGGPATVAAR